jgi:hypothetical protein
MEYNLSVTKNAQSKWHVFENLMYMGLKLEKSVRIFSYTLTNGR